MRISDWSSDVCSSDNCAVIGWMNLVARSDVPKAESAIAVQSRDGIDLPRHRSTIWIDPCHPSPTKSRAKIWKAYSKLAGRIIRPYRNDDRRAEERRVGQRRVRTWRYRWATL